MQNDDPRLEQVRSLNLSALELASLTLERFRAETHVPCKGFCFTQSGPTSAVIGGYGGYEETKVAGT